VAWSWWRYVSPSSTWLGSLGWKSYLVGAVLAGRAGSYVLKDIV